MCFRPALPPKPRIAGTVPARVTSPQEHDPYGHIDIEGRYKVNFLFDRDTWKPGEESLWLRLARPYAGDTHGLHLPLIPGTEVAIAFEQGDPDRPYIAHALHDSQHPDHVTLRNYKRNVLRTPANNKLRMDDTRGQEHVKLSTEHSGKSQLNLGHLVDAKRQPRGQGAELRTDGHAAIRAGSGILISADAQPKAQGHMLEMSAALGRLQQASDQLEGLSTDAQAANAGPADVQAQLKLMRDQLDQLKASVVLLSAPPRRCRNQRPTPAIGRSGQPDDQRRSRGGYQCGQAPVHRRGTRGKPVRAQAGHPIDRQPGPGKDPGTKRRAATDGPPWFGDHQQRR